MYDTYIHIYMFETNIHMLIVFYELGRLYIANIPKWSQESHVYNTG